MSLKNGLNSSFLSDYESEGRGFESLRARQKAVHAFAWAAFFLLTKTYQNFSITPEFKRLMTATANFAAFKQSVKEAMP